MILVAWIIAGCAVVVALVALAYAWFIRTRYRAMNDGWAALARDAVVHGVRAGVHFGTAGVDEETAAGLARDQQELLAAERAEIANRA